VGLDDATPTQRPGEASDEGERPSGHHGLVGMRERARLIGGRVRVTSRPDHGTRISVRVPRDQDETR
jgi:signal transduction histidine kinase